MGRKHSENVVVHGTDHEDFGSNEHPNDNLRAINPPMFPNQGFIGIGVAPVRWGGECRVEVDLEADLVVAQDNAIRIAGQARFFEGASEDTTEEEDRKDFDFVVPRTLNNAPPTTFSVPLRNSTVIGAEDHAEVLFTLSNLLLETE